MSHMPWTKLQPDTLRAVLDDLGLSKYSSRKKAMVKILQDIQEDGLEAVAQELEEQQVALNREHSPAYSFAPTRIRDESPELEHRVPRPRARPVVEIPVPSSSRSHHLHAGPPAAKKLKITPPSYAIIFEQEHKSIAPLSNDPHPLSRPDQRFDGVYLPLSRKHARLSSGPRVAADRGDDAEGASASASGSRRDRRASEGRMEGASQARAGDSVSRGTHGSHGASRTMWMDAVVIPSPPRRPRRRERDADSEDE